MVVLLSAFTIATWLATVLFALHTSKVQGALSKLLSVFGVSVVFSLAYLLTEFSVALVFRLRSWDDWNWDTPMWLAGLAILWLFLVRSEDLRILRGVLYGGAALMGAFAIVYSVTLLAG